MSKIKFRAYIKPLKRYAKNYETILYHHQCNMEPSWTVNISPEECYGDGDLIIEQSTGLLDRNGKEIFTGDVVKQLMYVLEGKKCITTWVVRWNNDEFCYDLHRVSGALYGDSMLSTCASESCEVIGNIHELNME